MSGGTALASAAVLLCFAAAWELLGSREAELRVLLDRMARRARREPSLESAVAALRLGVPQRIERAGLTGRVRPATVLGAKAAGVGLGAAVAMLAAPAAPARLGVFVALGLPLAGFLAPDALLERRGRLRYGRLVGALPDALDLMAAGAAAGRSPAAALGAITGGEGPLAVELRCCVAEIACGTPALEALDRLRGRVGGAELAALAATVRRSQRYGSPLADQLRDQATALRRERRRLIEEHAARAAPKIQLVVALVLVPSVLLMIVAALLGNTGAITGAFTLAPVGTLRRCAAKQGSRR